MLEILKAILFGIVQGVTEWLPISSTGHMILLNEFVKLDVSEQFFNMFEVVIQFGSILAVVVVFWNKIWPFYFGQKAKENGGIIRKDIFTMWFKVLVACVPAAIVGVLFDELLDKYLYNYWTVAIMLVLFGVLFIIVENRRKGHKPKIKTLADITYTTAIMIGVFQLIAAVFPGTSRSGATIVGALMIGVSRSVAAEFTFFLAIPVMFGASLLKLVKFGLVFTGAEMAILVVGMFVAFFVSIIVIKFLMGYIKKHDFKVFGVYRIILGTLVLIYFGLIL